MGSTGGGRLPPRRPHRDPYHARFFSILSRVASTTLLGFSSKLGGFMGSLELNIGEVFGGWCNFFIGGNVPTMPAKKELWDALDNEAAHQYEAFRCWDSLHPKDRSAVNAYRLYTDNPEAKGAPAHFSEWMRKFAWPERSRAHDNHLERVRRRGQEKAIEEEARRHAVSVEKTRARLLELCSNAYVVANSFLLKMIEDEGRGATLRDVVRIIELHLRATEQLGAGQQTSSPDTWTEEDDELVSAIVAEIDAEEEAEAARPDGPEGPPEGLS